MTGDRQDSSLLLLASPVLIVDDSEINRIFLEEILRADGFHNIRTAASGEQALRDMRDHAPEMVLLDIIMPGMDGFDCCAAIRAQPPYRDLPILIQTSVTEPELRVKAFARGATDFVSKPVFPAELCARVRVHLENRHARAALQIFKNRMDEELESARRLQQSILPPPDAIDAIGRSCRLDIASYFAPCSEIGGDLWGIKNLFPGQVALWLMDVSGHGVAAALNAFRLQAYVTEHTPLMARPGEYLSQLNEKLLPLLMRGQFICMFYGIIDTQSRRLFYASAGIPHPIIVRKENGKAEKIDGGGRPLGLGIHVYQTQTLAFAAGDMLLLHSDALIETPNAAGDYLGEDDIMQVAENMSGASATQTRDGILDLFTRHAGAALRDDLTEVVCAQTAAPGQGLAHAAP